MAKKGLKVRVQLQFKRVKAKIQENGECLAEEQRKIRAKVGDIGRQCNQLKQDTEMVVEQTAKTQLKLALMFNILKARESGDFIEATKLTQFLREIVDQESSNASLSEVKDEDDLELKFIGSDEDEN